MSSLPEMIKAQLGVPEQAGSHNGLGFLSPAQISSAPDAIQHEIDNAPVMTQNMHPYVSHVLQHNQAQNPILNSFPVTHPGIWPGACQPTGDASIDRQAQTTLSSSAYHNRLYAASAPGTTTQPIIQPYSIPQAYQSAQNSPHLPSQLSQHNPRRNQSNQARPASSFTQNNQFNIPQHDQHIQTPQEVRLFKTGRPSQQRQNRDPDSVAQNSNELPQSNGSQQKNDFQLKYATQGNNGNGPSSLDDHRSDSVPTRKRKFSSTE